MIDVPTKRQFIQTIFRCDITLCSSNKLFPVHAMKPYRLSGGIAALSLNLSTRCRWKVNFMPWLL
jgi:hypothetical protein